MKSYYFAFTSEKNYRIGKYTIHSVQDRAPKKDSKDFVNTYKKFINFVKTFRNN